MQVHELPRRPNPNLDHIPGDYGLPVIGHTFGLLRNSHKVGKHMLDTYGPVFRSSALFQRSVGLVGPEAARFVLLDGEQNFAAEPAWNLIIGGLFEGGLLLKDFSDHRFHRRALQHAFKKPVLGAYCTSLNRYLAEGIGTWPVNSYFDLFPRLKGLLLENAIQSFFGEDPHCNIQELSRAFIAMLDATLTLVRKPLPGSKWRRGMAGREVIKAYLKDQIQLRKNKHGADMFSLLCQATDEEGNQYTDEEVIDHMNFLMMAAHDTTTSTLTSMTYALAKHPEWQERLLEEVQSLGVKQLQYEDLEKMELTDWVMKEALRMYPPLSTLPKYSLKSFEFEGLRIPAGAMVATYPIHTHYMEEYWSEPLKFDPLRFSAGRAEHKNHPYCWVPFGGGGAHMCLGLHFAEMQTKVVLFEMLRQYRWSVPDNYTMAVQQSPISKPRDGLPVYLTNHRHTLRNDQRLCGEAKQRA